MNKLDRSFSANFIYVGFHTLSKVIVIFTPIFETKQRFRVQDKEVEEQSLMLTCEELKQNSGSDESSDELIPRQRLGNFVESNISNVLQRKVLTQDVIN